MRRVATFGLYVLTLFGLTGCPFVPPEPYGSLTVTGPDGGDYYGYSDLNVCAGESLTLSWQLENVSQATLSAVPPSATSPALTGRRVRRSGSLGVQILGATTLRLDFAEYNAEQAVTVIPGDVCTGFPVQPLGRFRGDLRQTFPNSKTLSRELLLSWNDGLRGELGSYHTPADVLYLSCTTDALADSLTCTASEDNEAGDTFNLSAVVTATGLEGTYEGTFADATSSSTFKGTFAFEKRP